MPCPHLGSYATEVNPRGLRASPQCSEKTVGPESLQRDNVASDRLGTHLHMCLVTQALAVSPSSVESVAVNPS